MPTLPPSTQYVIFRGEVITLTLGPDNLWRSPDETVWAFRDSAAAVDNHDTCGVGFISLPDWEFFREVNDSCKPHDYAYSSPAYQAFHTRDEADVYLGRLLELQHHPILGEVFSELAKLFGVGLWENQSTR